MDIQSTKTRAEREDEEAERLVRPAPDLKPPRHDKRRERVESDPNMDPDEEADKKDRSKNYKNVGGSELACRVVYRLLTAEAQAEKITVIKRETGRKVRISPETLKEQPGEYELPEEEEEKAPEEPPKEEKEPEEKPKKRTPEEFATLSSQLRQLAKQDKHLAGELAKFKPDQFYGKFVEGNPDFPADKFPWVKALPKEFQGLTIGDLAKVLAHKPAKKPAKAAPVPKVEKPSEEPEDVTEEAVPEKAKKPKTEEERADEEVADKLIEQRSEELVIPQPARPPASRRERRAAIERILDTFPEDVAADLVAANLHPEDVNSLIASYEAVSSSKPPKDIGSFASQVGQFYETNPARVKPPKTGKNYLGKSTPFDELKPEEKAEAYRQHQLRTVAISLGAKRSIRESLISTLPKGVDPRMVEKITSVMLQPPGEAREKLAAKVADQTFEKALDSESVAIPAKHTKAFLDSLGGNPDAQRIAVAYLQAQDYLTAKQLFLTQGHGVWGETKKTLAGAGKFVWSLLTDDEDDEEASDAADDLQEITEWSSPEKIASGIQSSKDYFKLRARHYPPELTEDRDPSAMFTKRVLERIETLAPEKSVPARLWLETRESEEYERQLREHEKRLKEWEAAQKQTRGDGGPYRSRQVDQEESKPKEPRKPAHYDRTRNPQAVKKLRETLLEEQFAQFGEKTAARVAARHISSYLSCFSMNPLSGKAAVYHGVAPYQDTPGYSPWGQVHQRDIGEPDHELLLNSAKDWLNSPVLAMPMVGATRDTQLRAALDLAIHDSPYNGAITANLYNTLLARLAGANEHETLLTVKQAENSSFDPSTNEGQKVANMKASVEIRKLAAKYAAQNAPLAYDLMDLATRVAQEEQDDEDQGQKQAQDQGQDDEQQKQAKKYAALRSVVIQAAAKNPGVRPVFVPVLQAIKGLDG